MQNHCKTSRNMLESPRKGGNPTTPIILYSALASRSTGITQKHLQDRLQHATSRTRAWRGGNLRKAARLSLRHFSSSEKDRLRGTRFDCPECTQNSVVAMCRQELINSHADVLFFSRRASGARKLTGIRLQNGPALATQSWQQRPSRGEV